MEKLDPLAELTRTESPSSLLAAGHPPPGNPSLVPQLPIPSHPIPLPFLSIPSLLTLLPIPSQFCNCLLSILIPRYPTTPQTNPSISPA